MYCTIRAKKLQSYWFHGTNIFFNDSTKLHLISNILCASKRVGYSHNLTNVHPQELRTLIVSRYLHKTMINTGSVYLLHLLFFSHVRWCCRRYGVSHNMRTRCCVHRNLFIERGISIQVLHINNNHPPFCATYFTCHLVRPGRYSYLLIQRIRHTSSVSCAGSFRVKAIYRQTAHFYSQTLSIYDYFAYVVSISISINTVIPVFTWSVTIFRRTVRHKQNTQVNRMVLAIVLIQFCSSNSG